MAEEQISFELVNSSAEHAKLVMDWRNDPDTRAMFYHREPKVWGSFQAEFANEYFKDPDLPALFALKSGARVAFLRFTRCAHPRAGSARQCCDISINVAPGLRGHGLGSAVLRAVQPVLQRAGYDDVLAEVRVENVASQKVFARAGFERLDEREKLIDDTGERCRIVRCISPLTTDLARSGRVFVIAEAGSNWRMGTPARDRAMSRALIDVAVEAGADAVKFQTYRPETVYVPNAGTSDYLADAGVKEDIREIFADLAMPYSMIPELAEYCKSRGIMFMSTPFSVADFEQIDPYVSIHKCASYENSHLRLLERFGRSKKPLVMSTGASTTGEIAWALDTFRANGGREVALLQCTAKYPAPLEAANLAVIPRLRRLFGVSVGLSDHTRDPVFAPLAAVALGASVIEKHYTLDSRLPGPDHSFAVSADGLKQLVTAVRAAEALRGSGVKEVLGAEEELRVFARRGVQAVKAIAPGEVLREGVNVDILRPGKQRLGAHPRELSRLEGKKSARAIALGEGIRVGDWLE
jgi:N-acetylneuraminate synthase